MAKEMLCVDCYTRDKPKLHTKGSIIIEIFLWILFIVPGLIYSIWRHASRHMVCRKCGSTHIIPLNSPRADQLIRDGHVRDNKTTFLNKPLF